jgi:hypothetical protein
VDRDTPVSRTPTPTEAETEDIKPFDGAVMNSAKELVGV